MLASGHYLATLAGLRILQQGGNAADAGVTTAFCLSVLEPHQYGIGGEAIMLFRSAERNKVFAISGHGVAPRKMNIKWFREHGMDLIPEHGLLPANVPAAFDGLVTVLREFGTVSLEQALTPAVELAESGFPMHADLRNSLLDCEPRFREFWPTSVETFLPGGRVPDIGEVYRQPFWAATFRKVLKAEKDAAHKGRDAALEAARDYFYKGEIAEKIAEFAQTEVPWAEGKARGFLEYDDLAAFHARVEDPVTTSYRGYDVYKCPSWCQGPVFLQQLNLLEGFDLAAMGHNSADYIHTVTEAAKLAFADREAYYGDPLFDDVPMDVLLSKEYANTRRQRIDPKIASAEFVAGDVGRGPLPYDISSAKLGEGNHAGDTTHLDVIDAAGNMFSATTSGGWLPASPAVKGLGFPLPTRCQMFYLDSSRPNALQPGKRPRSTLTPSLALKDGRPYMAFGTPGGDNQDQWSLQFFLNVVDFDMNLQAAIDVPYFYTQHFPCSFYPKKMFSKRVVLESRIDKAVISEMERRGHDVLIDGPWSQGRVLGIRFGKNSIEGAASPRTGTPYAAGW